MLSIVHDTVTCQIKQSRQVLYSHVCSKLPNNYPRHKAYIWQLQVESGEYYSKKVSSYKSCIFKDRMLQLVRYIQ